MFGYVLPYKPELKVREWQAYRSVYCGLCKEIKRNYGLFARFILNYDFVLLALIADNLGKEHIECSMQNCIANPFAKRPVCKHTEGLNLASHTLMLSVFYKLKDNLSDDRFIKKIPTLAFYPLANLKRKKAVLLFEGLDKILNEQTIRQSELENRKTQNFDEAADPTSIMTATIFSLAGDENTKTSLYRLGLFLGKIIYYLDAAEDFEKDEKNKSYNVFLQSNLTKEQAVIEAKRLCKLCAYEMSLAYALLPRAHNSELLDNIIYMGIPYSIQNAGMPKQKQINGEKNEFKGRI